jgi:hypothetical protein
MPEFRCLPIADAVAERFRATDRDDRGHAFRRRQPGSDSRCPCRACLRYAQPGETVLLGSYDLPRPQGVYWTPSPIFLHESQCAPFAAVNAIPEIVRGALVSVRAYDADDLCIYELGHAAEGGEIDDALTRALGDRRTDFVNIHTAKPGCLLCRVERC